jgi:hypothetical protein
MTLRSLVIFACAVALLLALAAAFNFGRQAHGRLENAEAAASEEETRGFCRGLGFAPESEAYARCSSGVNEIMRHRRERREAEAAGIL